MKSIKLYIITPLLVVSFLLLNSCKENNDPELLFDGTPSERVDRAITELRTALQSSDNGWKITYFTDDTQLGGYTFLFNFINDKEVIMDADFSTPDPTKASLYDITLGSTIKLTFTTKNIIHELSDGANFTGSLRGEGYRGDFEFLLYAYEGDDIIFRVNRDTSNFLRFTRATADDWTNIDNHQMIMDKIENDLTRPENFRSLKIKEESYSFSYNPQGRFASTTFLDFGIGFTDTGIIISPSLTIDDNQVSEFTYDSGTDSFIAEVNGNEVASIIYTNTVPLLNPYDFGRAAGNIRVIRTNLTSAPDDRSSQEFIDFFENWGTTFPAANPLSRVYVRNLNGSRAGDPFLEVWAGRAIAWFDCTYTVTEDTVGNNIVKFTPTGASNDFGLPDLFKPWLDFMFRTEGFYVQDMGTIPTVGNDTLGLIAVDRPTTLVHWYDF